MIEFKYTKFESLNGRYNNAFHKNEHFPKAIEIDRHSVLSQESYAMTT